MNRDHVAIPTRRLVAKNYLFHTTDAEDLTVKTFSVVAATQHVIGQNLNSFALHNIQDPEDKEVARRRIDCRKQLLTMKAGNVESDSEPTGQSVLQQEDLQEWLDNLQLKLRQACHVQPAAAAGPVRPTRPTRPSAHGAALVAIATLPSAATAQPKTVHLPAASNPSNSHPIRKFKAATGAISNPIIRPRSINGLADQAAAALTDSQYIERLQLSLQQASVSSLQERLAERKLHSIQIPPATPAVRSRPTKDKSPNKFSHLSPIKTTQKKRQPSRKSSKVTTSPSLPTISPFSQQQPPASLVLKKGETANNSRRSSRAIEEDCQQPAHAVSSSSFHTDNNVARQQPPQQAKESDTTPLPDSGIDQAKPESSFRLNFTTKNFFDRGQTINDIYEAAEHLLLPPARRENVPADQSTVQYDNPMMHRQLSDEDEIPEVEDFWGAVPDY